MNQKNLIIGICIVIIAVALGWLFIESSKPLPGQKFADLGRGHVPVGTEVKYNSNPPTSGKHYEEWIRAGVYNEPKDDRNLVHSLEHGYIIMSYKCTPPVILEGAARPIGSEDSIASSSSSASLSSDHYKECEERKNMLAKIYESKGKRKLIVVARENLDTNFAISAWTYLDKFNEFDEKRVASFIDAYRDQGPEKTME